jgi:PAS domain S-box-containing protein
MRSLLDNSPFGVISFDKNGKITIFNLQMERIFNKKEEDVLGKSFYEILPSEIIKDFKNKLYGLDKTITEKELQIKIDGKNLILYTLVVPIFENGKLLGVQVIFSDVTKIKQLEEEIKRNERLAALGVMAAGLAHEIKNPLTSLKTFAQLLPTRFDDPEFREVYSKLIFEEINRINNLVEQVLLFSSPRIKKLEEVNIVDIIKSTINLVSYQFVDKKVEIKTDFPEKDVIIIGDREKLKQVFMNLFINSFEAINSNNGKIEVILDEKEEDVEVLIIDNGCGIKKEIMNKIFDPFFTTKIKGTGLGLSIVLSIVEEHKGKVRVESEEGKGTKVSVLLPKKRVLNEVFNGNN